MDYRLKYMISNCKPPKRKHKEKLHDIGLGNDFRDVTPIVQAIKVKIDKLGHNICKACILHEANFQNM